MMKKSSNAVLIDIKDIKDKNLAKLVKKINELYEKKKMEKLDDAIKELGGYLQVDNEFCNIALVIFITVLEVLPKYNTEEWIAKVRPFLAQKDIKQRINAIGIITTYLNHKIETNQELTSKEIDEMLELLKDSNADIKHNVIIFLEAFPSELDSQLLPKLTYFLDIIRTENNSEILKTIGAIIQRILPKLSLTILLSIIGKLISMYQDSAIPERSDVILSLLEKEIIALKDRQKKNWTKKDIINNLNARTPLIRIYDIAKVSKEEDLDETKVMDHIKSGIDEKKIYLFEFTEKNKKFVVEFEKDPLLNLVVKGKVKIDELVDIFKPYGLESRTIINVLIKELIKQKYIRGFLSQEYFYSTEFIRNEILLKLQKEGKISIASYTNFLSLEFVMKILQGIMDQGTAAGIFDNKKEFYYTFNGLLKSIEAQTSKNSCVDFNTFKDTFEYEDFLRLEEEAHRQFLTNIHKNHVWLTNLGLTRIQNHMRIREQIGLFDINIASKELGIPVELLTEAIKGMFDQKNGFWNQKKTIFYFGKYVKKQLGTIENEKQKNKRDMMIEKISKDLEIDKEQLSKKVDEKLHEIAEKLMKQEEFEILPLLRDLQMERPEFINFINGLDRPYLILSDRVIFSEKRINEEKNRLRESIETALNKETEVDFDKLSKKLHASIKLILELFNQINAVKKIRGIWITDNKFLTEKGIIAKMLESKKYLALNTFILDRRLMPNEIELLDTILKSLRDSGQLKGNYDEEEKIFQAEDLTVESNIEKERERFVDTVNTYIKKIELNYNIVKEILMGEDILPSQMEEYEQILDETCRELIVNSAAHIKGMINFANHRIRKSLAKNKEPSSKKTEDDEWDFAKDPIVANSLDDFEKWRAIMIAVQQKAGQIVFLKKRLKTNPKDEESKQKLNAIAEYLGFT